MSSDTDTQSPQYGFNCSNCGETNVVETDSDPETLENKIFECSGCGENIRLNNYVGDSDE